MAEPDITQSSLKQSENGLYVNQKPLKYKHSVFVQAYMLTKSASEAIRRCGYNGKNAHVSGYKLLQNPRVKAEIERLEAIQAGKIAERVEEKLEEQLKSITKDTFVDKALKDYEALDPKEANRPRYLDLAGRAAGIIGTNGDNRPHQTLIVNVDAKTLDAPARWDRLRALIDNA